jgi:hypothetical protein
MNPNTTTKAEFSRRKGWNRSTATRQAQAGRIILDIDGNVLIAESEARLAETADASKIGVVKRHEIERGQKVLELAMTPDRSALIGKKTSGEGYSKRVNESARREAALADMAEMERDRIAAKMTDIEGVERALADYAVLGRQSVERFAIELDLKLGQEIDRTKRREIVKLEVNQFCRQLSATFKALSEGDHATRQ